MAAGGAPPAPTAPADAGAHGDAGTRAAACSGRWAGAFADAAPDGQPTPIDVLPPGSVRGWLDGLPPAVAAWLTATRPALSRPAGPSPGTIVVVPSLGDEGAPRAVARVLLVVAPGGEAGVWAYAGLPAALPGGVFELVPADGGAPVGDGPALGWALGAYAWDGYKKKGGTAADVAKPTLVWPARADRVMVGAAAAATYLARDLVNEPASALGPAELEAAVRGVAAGIDGATVDTVVGDDLLAAGWPMVHAVGRAAAVGREPRLIELRWTGPDGDDRPEVVLVGKGVVFDTGGVNVKTTAGMRTMKKGTCVTGGGWGREGGCLTLWSCFSVPPSAQGRVWLCKCQCAANWRRYALTSMSPLCVVSLTIAFFFHCAFCMAFFARATRFLVSCFLCRPRCVDMAGAAQTLGLAQMIMDTALPIRLRLLIPAVENSIAGNAFRTSDVLAARNGLTSEIVSTDAEGRLILADALVAACEPAGSPINRPHPVASDESADDASAAADTPIGGSPPPAPAGTPALVVDCATLTGAQRVAMGPDIPSFWTHHDAVAARLDAAAAAADDLVWRLPLHEPYRKMLSSSVADCVNCSSGGYAGAITAALYLEQFVTRGVPWVHVDFMGFNASSSPGRPEGGEAMGLRALYGLIHERFGRQ